MAKSKKISMELGPEEDSSFRRRLNPSDFQKVEAAHIHKAVEELCKGSVTHAFAPSKRYDVVLGNGTRLAPKAVFGLAAKRALNREVGPYHFLGGEETPCFQAIREAGYTIKAKDRKQKSSAKAGQSSAEPGKENEKKGVRNKTLIAQTNENLASVAATEPLTRWLVEAAIQRGTVTYGRVQLRLQGEHGFDRIFPINIGKVADAAMERMLALDANTPMLNVLLVRSDTGLPGAGAAALLSRRYPGKDWLRRKHAHKDSRWRELVEQEAGRVFAFQRWEELYKSVYGRRFVLGESQSNITSGETRGKGAGGEGPNHCALRLRVVREPQLVQEHLRAENAKTEVELLSGDRVDVVCYSGDRTLAIEVKSRDSDRSDILRGIFQCVKYRAVLRAQDIRLDPDIEAWLVTEESLPHDLKELARRLSVRTKVISQT